jgi:hypothetical protein
MRVKNTNPTKQARAPLQVHDRVEAEPRMDVEQVARGVVYMAALPLDANVQFITVMATKMPYIRRGDIARADYGAYPDCSVWGRAMRAATACAGTPPIANAGAACADVRAHRTRETAPG